jgi:hypothetical protein
VAKFDYMTFGYSSGSSDIFVANAKKFTKEKVVEICKGEYEHKFTGYRLYGREIAPLREPTIADVSEGWCAYRFGMSEWPDGCYTFVNENENGAFPVYAIIFKDLTASLSIAPEHPTSP